MARVRIAVLAVALLSVELSAQSASQGHLKIQVTDTCGDVIPGARIEIDPTLSKLGYVHETDPQGAAMLVLPIGVHTLSITFKNLEQWTRQIDVQAAVNPPVVAMLSQAGTIVDCVTVTSVDDSGILTESPEPIFLQLQPLLNLDPLPSRHAKRRR